MPYWAIAVVAVVVLATIAAFVVIARKPPEYANPVLVGAGDISSCHNDSDDATARLLEDIRGTVFTMGDNAYPSGTSFQFKDCYGPNWGEYKARTKPAVGNHEYETDGAAGYFDYFGSAAGPPSKGYYSYDLGDWHVVVLNSMCEEVGGCGPGSPMVGWLSKDLAANPNNKCTLAYFHHPLFSSGHHGNQTKMTASWEALYEANADVVVNGHDHDYERFAPQTPDGTKDPRRGIREFVVGTGGAERRPFRTIQPHSEARDDNTPGVLKLTLKPAGYDWKFVPVAGEIFTDSGTGSCH